MTPVSQHPTASSKQARSTRFAVLLVLLAGTAAYSNSFQGVPHLDDGHVLDPNHNRSLVSPWNVFHVPNTPEGGQTTSGRPIFALTIALNYAIEGVNTFNTYHGLNLLVHLLGALTLLGLVRRTLSLPEIPEPLAKNALKIATAIACLWVVHPLTTIAVTYIVQRAEAMMALFYLLTLYAFIRSQSSRCPVAWLAGSVAACLLGMGCKEVSATIPFAVLLYDRCYVAGTFRSALRKRWGYYLALMSTLGGLVLLLSNRGNSVGFGGEISSLSYACTQFYAITRYLFLSLLPVSLVFDYGTAIFTDPSIILPRAVIVLALLTMAIYLLWKKPRLGFPAFFFFLVLAPTSTFIPVQTQTIAEHRMYLPLAAELSILIVLGALGWKKMTFRIQGLNKSMPMVICVLLVLTAGTLTWKQNRDYSSRLVLSRKSAQQFPQSFRAWATWGNELRKQKKTFQALEKLNHAFSVDDDQYYGFMYRGMIFYDMSLPQRAASDFEQAVFRADGYRRASALCRLGVCLNELALYPNALRAFTDSLELSPISESYRFRGIAYWRLGQLPEAQRDIQAAIAMDATTPAYFLLAAMIYKDMGQLDNAKDSLRIFAQFNLDLPPEAKESLGPLYQTISPARAPYPADSE